MEIFFNYAIIKSIVCSYSHKWALSCCMPGQQWYMEWQISAKKKTVTQRKELHPIVWMNLHANLTQAMKHRYNIIIGSSWLVTCCICCHDRQWNRVRWRGWRYICRKVARRFTFYCIQTETKYSTLQQQKCRSWRWTTLDFSPFSSKNEALMFLLVNSPQPIVSWWNL